ncbi:MAG: exodeoxyribonuclease VII large subunit [Nitrospirales bacterium]
MRLSSQPQRILTISELTLLIRDRLEQTFAEVWVEGEVSNLRMPASGHLYFTLKDAQCQLRSVLFRAGAQRLRFALQEGLQVIARGRLTVYEPRGEYQIVVEYLEPKGVGALQLAFEQLKDKLAREGLFDEARKRPLPFLPRRVGLVTSLSGAALRDMVTVLRRRCPIVHLVLAPVPVQGEGAAPLIAEAIETLSASKLVDVMIVGRGGGSLEDLWCFNDERVVRAIAASAVPVVSAVGHEIDITLADFAADHRAPTPSAAAEAVVPVLADLLEHLESLRQRLERGMRMRTRPVRTHVVGQVRVMTALMKRLQRDAQRLDDLQGRTVQAVRDLVGQQRQRMLARIHGLRLQSPRARIRHGLTLVPQLFKRLQQRMLAEIQLKRQGLRSLAASLDSLSPLSVLSRGYSILQTVPDGHVLRTAQDVRIGDTVRARLHEGELRCEVRDRTMPDSKRKV